MNAPGQTQAAIADALAAEIKQATTVHMNVGGNTIIVTEDRVRLCLLTHLASLASRQSWIAPAGVLITIVTALATSTFHDALLKASTWQAIFVVSALVDTVWLVVTLLHLGKAPTIDDVVSEIKQHVATCEPR